MERLKNSGFYKLKFFITPEELKSLLALFEQKQVQFIRPNHAQTKYDYDQVYEAYSRFYQSFTATKEENREEIPPHFVYSLLSKLDQGKSGFFLKNEGVCFPYLGQWAEDELPSIVLSFPKGVQMDLEDEIGKYYIYEDIREHRPLTYGLYHEVANEIKKITKLLRFSVPAPEGLHEQKTSVRVSKEAMNDMRESWIFNKYSLVMNTK
ncbi:hypothetical protein P4H27_21350 [Paenibacillus taichungensis]|uniref:hypothetical protein n=1 Tax=Paenibacillus TaxID=44249 RepID=UPI00096F1FE1|nr:hypothetical protein [Paenibacillus taichungensis]MDR9748167.1 hypothetical protein [Paenibacillus taichungensis]MEC0109517.1 hypothetical protein [Paenibacillus taichungensis]MEC0197445.1 hypothetical protein [Paenibacillus taichungensis]OME85419.1 hypothetical protein BK122_00550 [Paenibacillus pabuli]